MRVNVHVGVHKTATTYIQDVLEASRPELNAAGIGFLPRRFMRELMTNKIEQISPESFRLEDMLEFFFVGEIPSDIKGLVISDENLLGHTSDTIKTGRLYPNAPKRLERLRALLAGHEVAAFMGIRSYDEFIASLYCEAMHWQRFCPFGTFVKRMDFSTFRWPRFYAGSISALSPGDVQLWRYEDFRPQSEEVIRALAFGFEGALDLDQPDTKIGVSQAAMDRLHEINRELGPGAVRERVKDIKEQFPKTAGIPAFSPWTTSTRAQLRDAYAQDCTSAPGKWLIPPPAISRSSGADAA